MENSYRILIVDDDVEILRLVQGVLERAGMSPLTAQTVVEAESLFEQEDIDLIVLDLMMKDEDGLSFCRRLRAKSSVPVIILTALSSDIDRIVGLEVGADDYLGKPFNPRELVARIKAVMRRVSDGGNNSDPTKGDALTFGPFRLVPEQMLLTKNGVEEILLTSGEFALLKILVERAPRVLSRETLLDLSRGMSATPFDRTIDSQISRIRSKIGDDPRRPSYIKTVRNLGYALSSKVVRET
ncbi:MAG: response regulator [Pseudomonadota bacterium]